jgi:hypothetical protein
LRTVFGVEVVKSVVVEVRSEGEVGDDAVLSVYSVHSVVLVLRLEATT